MSDIDPWLAALAASQQAQRGAFNPKAKYPAETDKFLSEQDQFYQSIGYDPLDYAAPANPAVADQYVNEQGLPVVMVGDRPAWVGESPARSFYEGAGKDDLVALTALDAMDMIEAGTPPFQAVQWVQKQFADAQAGTGDFANLLPDDKAAAAQAFADPAAQDQIAGDVSRFASDYNTRAGVVDKAVLTESAKGDDYGMFQGGGQYTSGLGEDPFGYERGQAQGSLADYQGIDQAQIARLLQDQARQRDSSPAMQNAIKGAFRSEGEAPIGANITQTLGGAPARDTSVPQGLPSREAVNLASFVTNALGKQQPKPAGPLADFGRQPTEQDVRVGAAVQAGQNLYSPDEFVRGSARQAYANRQQDTRVGPNQGQQELIRRVVAERVRRGLEPLPSRPGPVRKAPTYNPTSHGARPKKVEKKG